MIRNSDCFKITYSRKKQGSDQRESVFFVPAAGGFADRLAIYLAKEEDKLPVEMVQEEEDLSALMLGRWDHLPALFYFSQYSAGHTVRHYKYSIIAGNYSICGKY